MNSELQICSPASAVLLAGPAENDHQEMPPTDLHRVSKPQRGRRFCFDIHPRVALETRLITVFWGWAFTCDVFGSPWHFMQNQEMEKGAPNIKKLSTRHFCLIS